MTSIDILTLPSTFGLTCLLFIGLGFFIRASIKDRTEVATYLSELNDAELLAKLQNHFSRRAYRVTHLDSEAGQITLEGTVGASVFLACFLGGLAAIGLFCLALVLTIAAPQLGYLPYLLIALTPAVPWFYWNGAARVETVTFQLQSSEHSTSTHPSKTQLKISAHRDELIALESAIPLKRAGVE